jgi:Domain of unknown function (DUF4189)
MSAPPMRSRPPKPRSAPPNQGDINVLSYRIMHQPKGMRLTAAVLLSVFTALLPSKGRATGAFAVGQVDGFAFAIPVNEADDAAASQKAIDLCRNTPDALKTPTLKADCKVIQTFSNKCAVVAWDPAPNYPGVGVGWSIADDLQTAQSQAIAKCKATAKPGRADSCVVSRQNCDGSAH